MSDSAHTPIQPPESHQDHDHDAWTFRIPRPVRREASSQYLVIALVSFGISVSLTRLFLSLSGYPQIGGSVIHISHVLWGGLFLFLACLLLLMISNRQVYKLSAVLAGIGIGLFIDEVGKFITQEYDYFYPLAAPIIYIFFMLFLLLVVRMQRQVKPTPRAELYRALEIMKDWIDTPLSDPEEIELIQRLQDIKNHSTPDNMIKLAGSLAGLVKEDARQSPLDLPTRWEVIRNKLEAHISERGLRAGLAVGFLLMALIAVENLAGDLLSARLPGSWFTLLLESRAGSDLNIQLAPGLYQTRVVLEAAIGCLLLANSVLLLARKTRLAIPLGFGILIFYLTAIDPLLFYFEQFSTILFVLFQFLLLSGLIQYRRRFLSARH